MVSIQVFGVLEYYSCIRHCILIGLIAKSRYLLGKIYLFLHFRQNISFGFPQNKNTSIIIKGRAIPQRIKIRMVSIFYTNLIVEVLPMTGNKCGLEAKACTIPDKNGTKLLSWRQGCCSGKIIALIERVRKQLGFTYSLYIVEDGKWGSKENGTWNGMIKDLIDGKADLALQSANYLEQRYEVIDYSTFTGTSVFGILRIKKVKKEFPEWTFLEPLSTNLKWVLCGTAFFSIFIILILENGRYLTCLLYTSPSPRDRG